MTNRIEIKFDEWFIDKIKTGEKYTTIRPANKLRGSLPYKRVIAGDIVCVYKHHDLELSITKVETTNLLEIIRKPSFWLRGEGLSDYHNPIEFLALWQEFYGGTEYDMSNNPAVVVIYFSCTQNQRDADETENSITENTELSYVQTAHQDFRRRVNDILDDIGDMLIEKHRLYGNSAMEPVRIFSHATSTEQLLVRIDDKEDTISDLIGYLVLLKAARETNND